MVQMGGRKAITETRRELAQSMEQRDRVGTAREREQDRVAWPIPKMLKLVSAEPGSFERPSNFADQV